MKVNPYEVEGKINYQKLVQDFGIKEIDDKLYNQIKSFSDHKFLRRNIFFAHRDLDKILDCAKKGQDFFMYTGIGPSGPMHLGHLNTFYFTKWLQDTFKVKLWVMFSDDEKYLFKDLSEKEIETFLKENIKDVTAVGFDPKLTNFIINTKHANVLYKHAIKVAKKITFSTVKGSFGFNNSTNIGSIFYTAMQTAPLLLEGKKRCLVPLGVDQDPHFRVSRDVIEKLGGYKPSVIHSKFMTPLSGNIGKMSTSNASSAILTTDTPNQVKKKINKYAFSGGQDTLEKHRKLGGNVDVDVSCQWLKYYLEDDKELEKIYKEYKEGKLLSGEIKSILIKEINKFLEKHQSQRNNDSKPYFNWTQDINI